MKRWMGLPVYLLFAVAVMVPLSSFAEAPTVMVGRIFHIEGNLLRYVPAEKDWVAVVRDAPFGVEDTLFSGSQGMAELIVPNGACIRIGNSTQVQFITLDAELAEMDVATGMARFYNKSADTLIKVTSPFGYVLGDPGTIFDFYVGDDSVEVVAVKGRVSFVHSATETRYDAAAGTPSILADQQQVSSGDGTVDPDWNRWNGVRENFWAAKAKVRGRSAQYLPPSLREEAYALEENGSWERVPYEGTERWFWRPRVAVGWSPFTVGRWTEWYGDQTWIPAEPFGYVTHHYGNWVYARNYWYWAPPVASVRIGLPLLDVGFFWYPGRVSWIHSGAYVGWVPLAPRETYYSYRHWGGPHAVVVNNVNFTQININVRNYAYANRAIVVNRNNFYGVNNYTKVRETNINPTAVINSYQAAPVINNAVINNYATISQRHHYTNAAAREKPHNTVINRIQQNQVFIREGKTERASVLQQRVKSIPEGRGSRETRIEQPKITNYLVPASEVNRPKSEIKLQKREIRSPGVAGPEQQPGRPAERSERVAPARPGQQERRGQPAGPERVSPEKPAQPAERSERVAPAKPGQQERRGQPAGPERVSPEKPAQPAERPERVAPAKPGQQERRGQPAGPERVSPEKPAQPAERPERVAPAKPGQQERRGQPAGPEQVSPEKPAQPAERPERVAPAKPKEAIKPPERKVEEKPKEQRPAQKQIEKPNDPRPSEKNVENRKGQKRHEEEDEKPKK
jgi:hypothetical protein